MLLLGIVRVPARLDQHCARAPLAHEIAEGTRIERVVVLRDLTADQRVHRLDDQRGDLHRTASFRVDVAGLVERGGEQRDSDSSVRCAHTDRSPLVVQIESEVGLEGVVYRLERASLRCLELASVAVHIDPLRVPSLETLRAIRVEHGDHVDRRTLGDASDQWVITPLMEEPYDVSE